MSLYGARLKCCPFVHTCVVSGLAGRRRRQRLQHRGFKDRRLLAAHSRARSTVVNCCTRGRSSHISCRTCVRLSRHSRRVHASARQRLLREHPTSDMCAAGRRDPQSRGFRRLRRTLSGFTACDAPGWCKRFVDGVEREFFDDIARGAVVQSIVLHCRIARPVGGSLRITSASIKASRADDRELPD
jgi:hypothetical protein